MTRIISVDVTPDIINPMFPILRFKNACIDNINECCTIASYLQRCFYKNSIDSVVKCGIAETQLKSSIPSSALKRKTRHRWVLILLILPYKESYICAASRQSTIPREQKRMKLRSHPFHLAAATKAQKLSADA